MAIVNRLFEIRTQRELTQEDVAQMTGVSRVTVGRVDRNRHYRPKGKTMQDLARGMNLRIGELFDDDELGQPISDRATATPRQASPARPPDAEATGSPDLVAAGVTRVPLGRERSVLAPVS